MVVLTTLLVCLALYPFMRKRLLALSMPVRVGITTCSAVAIIVLFTVYTEPSWIWVGMAGLIIFGFCDATRKRKINDKTAA